MALSTLNAEVTMTAQEFYDKTCKHLVEQGRRAADVEGNCLYRMPQSTGSPLKCAAGIHIPDEEYIPKMEQKSVSQLIDMGLISPESVLGYHLELADLLQKAHDWTGNWTEYSLSDDGKADLNRIATNYGLVPYFPL
jgi:hypothetical protein